MISYKKKVLDNGLTVIAHRDNSTPMAAVNIIYKVGARNENPANTGFAHLFEHLMFGGSENAPYFDVPVQMAAGKNNAFTNNDYTDYYIVLPKDNIETALWLESDRMHNLVINNETLELQKKVVIEEFNQRYLNKPYGDIWLLLRPLAYKVHPYRWATIGMTPDHIRNARIEDVESFYKRFYNPNNAILTVAGDFEAEEVFEKVEKWFGDIPKGTEPFGIIPQEPLQTEPRRELVERKVPASVIYVVYHMSGRFSREFHICDTISDILSNGTSARMYQNLVKKEQLFTSVNAYVTGDMDPGLFVMTGQVAPGANIETAEKALLNELEKIKKEPVGDYELEKVKNKFEANTIFGEINVMNKAMNLCFYDMLGDIDLVNTELSVYRAITSDDIMQTANRIFIPENSSTLLYVKE